RCCCFCSGWCARKGISHWIRNTVSTCGRSDIVSFPRFSNCHSLAKGSANMLAENDEPVANTRVPDPDLPPAPRTPEETGLPFLFLVELVAKVLFLRGQV